MSELRAFTEALFDETFAAFSTPDDRAAIETEAANDAMLVASGALDFTGYVAALVRKYQASVIEGLPPQIAAHIALLAACFTALELEHFGQMTQRPTAPAAPPRVVVGDARLVARIRQLESDLSTWKAIACN